MSANSTSILTHNKTNLDTTPPMSTLNKNIKILPPSTTKNGVRATLDKQHSTKEM